MQNVNSEKIALEILIIDLFLINTGDSHDLNGLFKPDYCWFPISL